MADSTLVKISNSCSSNSGNIQLVLDKEKNQGKTDFETYGNIFFRAYPAGNYLFRSIFKGNFKVISTQNITEETEKITFLGTNKASTEYPIYQIKNVKWLGTPRNCSNLEGFSPAVRKVGSSDLETSDCCWGKLEITYTTSYALARYTPQELGEHLIIGKLGQYFGYLDLSVISYLEEEVTLTFVDACTGAPIPEATVEVDGVLKGETDAEGVIVIGTMTRGFHTVRASATQYIDTNLDSLDNEEFFVEGTIVE